MALKTFFNKNNKDIYDNNTNIVSNLNNLSDIISESFIILDKNHKIIYINKAASKTFSLKNNKKSSLKTGDLLNCNNIFNTDNNCGETNHCKFCNILNIITKSQNENKLTSCETSMEVNNNGIKSYIDLSVKSRPIKIDKDSFLLLSFEDISSKKRKHALERIFFHDILNTISGLSINLELLKHDKLNNEEKNNIIEKLGNINKSLYNEINSQKLLLNAENGTLEVQKNLVISTDLIYEILSFFSIDLEDSLVKIEYPKNSKSFSFITDHVLLKRILVNMIKNALEAENYNKNISIGCDQNIDNVIFWVKNPSTIENEIKQNIFKRSFSTKNKNRGLGTYSMKLLGEGYLNSKVYFTSNEKEGTTFFINLPRNIT